MPMPAAQPLDYAPPSRAPAARRQAFRSNLALPVIVAALALLGWILVAQAGLKNQEGRSIGWIDGYDLRIIMLCGVSIIMAVSLQLINGFSGQFSLGHAGFMAVGAYFSAYPSREISVGLTNPLGVLLFYAALFVTVGVGAALIGAVVYAARRAARVHPALGLAVFVGVVALVAVGLGVAGGPAVGRAWEGVGRAVAAGYPVAARASSALPGWVARPACFLILLVGGGLCAAVAGFIVGLPTLRLRGDYLAIATLGFAEIIRVAFQNAAPFGGALGMSDIPTYTTFGWLFGAAFVTVIVVWRIAYSAKGRAIQAVREDEIAASAVGIDPTHHKVVAFVVGAFFGGVGGVLYTHYAGFITPTDFNLLRSIEFVVMVTLGGLGSISGAILAAVVLTILPELLRFADEALPAAVTSSGFSLSDSRMVLYALLLIAMMLVRPNGLLGGMELWPRRRRYRPVDTSPMDDARGGDSQADV